MKTAIRVLQDRAKRKPLILVIDDETAVLDVLNMALPMYELDLKIVSHWALAVETYKNHKSQIDAALIDVQMPNCDGKQLLHLLRAITPELRACFMSGYVAHHTAESLLKLSGRPLIDKPFVSLDFVALSLWKMVDESSKRLL